MKRNTNRGLVQNISLGLSVLLMSSVVLAAGSGGSGFPSVGSGSPQSDRTPEERAASAYKSALKYKKKAWNYEAQAEKAKTERARQKLLDKAAKQYRKVIKTQRRAYNLDHRLYQALNELGYAYRKTGDYTNALAAYNTALKIRPDFLQAIEYRAEAMMALGYFEETKKAYIHLFRRDTDLAEQLMHAMEVWVEQHGENQNGTLDEKQKPFADWVHERSALMGQSQSLSQNNAREW